MNLNRLLLQDAFRRSQPDRWSRRDFLKTASAATLAALAAGAPGSLLAAEPTETIKPTADRVIVLWMAGGMAHTETFDPKRYTPYAAGLNPNEVLSTFPSIPTNVDGVQFSAGLDQMAPGSFPVHGCVDCHAWNAWRWDATGSDFVGPHGDPTLRESHVEHQSAFEEMWP